MLIKVRRGNVILQIEDDADNVQRYLDKGYSLIDQVTEEIIKEAIPNDVGELRALVAKQQKLIEELKANQQAPKTEEVTSDDAVEEKPKRRAKKQK